MALASKAPFGIEGARVKHKRSKDSYGAYIGSRMSYLLIRESCALLMQLMVHGSYGDSVDTSA
jgi:hypothetical protein